MNPFFSALQSKNAPVPLSEAAAELTEAQVQSWLQAVDESPFSLTQWAEALIEFKLWEQENRRKIALQHMLEYLNCCCESGMPAHLLPLPFLLKEYLRDHGVEE
ncbi:MAG: hypothetical protein H7333_04945 [Bdellovibrionales bacterium]|nr:hypothetical protein [Oligoflexia bacterium]